MKRRFAYLFFLMVLAAGCSERHVDIDGVEDGSVISFSPSAPAMDVKSLVSDRTGDGYISLEDACKDHTNNHILLFSEERTKEGDSEYEIFQTDKSYATWLCYGLKDGAYSWMIETDRTDAAGNPVGTKDKSWTAGSMYEFMALYPATLEPHIFRGLLDSETESMALSYNTHQLQEDVLVAYNEVNANDPADDKPSIFIDSGGNQSTVTPNTAAGNAAQYSFSNKFNLNMPVPLRFRHAMAAVRLRFHLDYYREVPDQLVETWFENTAENGFHTIGTMLYGIGSRPDEVGDPGRYNQKNKFRWTTYQTSYDASEIYKWSVKQPGGKFYRENPLPAGATAVTGNGIYTMSAEVAGKTISMVIRRNGENVTVDTPTLDGHELTTLEFLREKDADGKWTRVVPATATASIGTDGVITVTSTRVDIEGATLENNDATIQKIDFTVKDNGNGTCTTEGSVKVGYGESFYYTGKETRGNALSFAAIPGVAAESELFTGNNNTVLVIPQVSSGHVKCFFRLHSSESEAGYVTIPAFTGTKYNPDTEEVVECPEGQRTAEQANADTQYNYYCPGYVYTYTIHIARSTAYINVQIQPWNEIHSSADIIF